MAVCSELVCSSFHSGSPPSGQNSRCQELSVTIYGKMIYVIKSSQILQLHQPWEHAQKGSKPLPAPGVGRWWSWGAPCFRNLRAPIIGWGRPEAERFLPLPSFPWVQARADFALRVSSAKCLTFALEQEDKDLCGHSPLLSLTRSSPVWRRNVCGNWRQKR